MMKYGKKLGKRITSLMMTLVIVMTIVMSVEPMEAWAATTYSESVNASAIRVDDILTASAVIVKDSLIYDSIRISVDNDKYWTDIYNTLNVSSILNRLGKSNLYTIRCTGFSSNSLNFVTVKPPEATVTTKPTAAESLVYDGSDKSLLATGGTATNGTMCYRVTTTASAPADSEFTITNTNDLTEKNAGTYYVWYMAKGNTGYVNSSKGYFEVQIAKATPPILTTPTVSNPVPYGTALSAISLGTDWVWENENTVPDVGKTGYTAVYNKTLDTANYEWSSVEGYDNGTIKRTVDVTVNPVEKTDATFTVPTNLSNTYDATKTLSELMPFTDSNWAWINGSIIPKVSDTRFTAKYTVPSPDDKNYTWDKVTGYKTENGKIIIERELPVTISSATQTADVHMENYNFGDTISEPTITGEKESPTVTYYYNTENSNQGGTKWENMTSSTLDKGTYYMYAVLSATDNYAAYTTPAVSFTVNPKTMTGIMADSVNITYDGMEHSITVSGYPEGATVYYGTSADNCNLTSNPKYKDAQKDAYTVYYKITAKGYNDYTGFATVKINPKVAELSWGNTSFIYNGSVQTPSATVSNLCGNDTCTVTVEGGQTNYSASAYTATATALGNSNYKLPDAENARQTEFTISPKIITADMISLDKTDKEYTVTGGTITPEVTVKDGTVTLEKGETKDYVLSGETSHEQYGTHTITVTGKGNYTGSVDVAWNITDPNAPSGNIVIKSKSWDSFPTGVGFKYFFKETQTVKIQATDGSQESGVDKVYYCKSLTPFTTADQLNGVTWTEIANGGSFDIIPNANVYVYAKITDKAGNVTYLVSDGMVIYTDSAQITESITFTKTSNEDVTADVALNGNTINTITLGDTTLVKDRDYTISENGATIAFKASFLQTLAASDTAYTLTVSYNPGGKTFVEATGNERPLDTTIALTVEKAQGSVTAISDISKVYDGHAVGKPTFNTTNDKGTNNANVTFAYKEKGAEDSAYTDRAPVNAGTYVVKVMVAANDNYEAVSNTAEFTISKAEISVSATDYDDVYDGTAHGITVNVTDMTDAYTVSYGVMPEEAGAQIVYGQTPLTYKDAGTYTVYYKISSENYNDKYGSAQVKISPKTIGISWEGVSFVYDGKEHMPTATATGLEGDDACSITVTGVKLHAGTGYVATATAVSNPNYQLPEAATTEFAIVPADITLTAIDASKHIGKNDPEFTYKVTTGALMEDDGLTGISFSRTAGETAGEYVITATQQSESNPDYSITFVPGTFTIEDHVVTVDAAVAPTCTEDGNTEYWICSVCHELFSDENGTNETTLAAVTIKATGHPLTKIDAKDPTCTEDGNTAYWTCSVCNKLFSDEYGKTETTLDAVTIKAGHTLTKTDAKAATVTETGNIEYWHCKDCGKYFADENGTNEIILDDTVIAKLPPEIIEGKGQSITAGEKKELTFRSNAAFSDFICVEVDGKTLDGKNYTAKEGSTVVTLDADYVSTLSSGEHTIGIVSESGTASTTFTVNAKTAVENGTGSPQTGDNSPLALWIVLLLASGCLLAVMVIYGKKKKYNR